MNMLLTKTLGNLILEDQDKIHVDIFICTENSAILVKHIKLYNHRLIGREIKIN